MSMLILSVVADRNVGGFIFPFHMPGTAVYLHDGLDFSLCLSKQCTDSITVYHFLFDLQAGSPRHEKFNGIFVRLIG